ncbi:hypothetical protein GGG16DRAFT_62099 [Schizophyllum commune]
MATVTLLEPPRTVTAFPGVLNITGAIEPASAPAASAPPPPTDNNLPPIQYSPAPTDESPAPTEESASPEEDVDLDSESDNDSVHSWSTARTSHRHRERRVEFDPACTEITETVRTTTVWLDEHGHRRRSRERKRHRRRYSQHHCHDQIGWPMSRDMLCLVTLCFILGCLTIITFRPFALQYLDIDRDHDSDQ